MHRSCTPAHGNITANPQFVRTARARPRQLWGTADDDYGDLSLQRTSPAIDAGQNRRCQPASRPIFPAARASLMLPPLPTPAAARAPIVDMGAYESQYAPVSFSGTVSATPTPTACTTAGEAGGLGNAVYLDANANGALDSGEATTRTDVAGAYSFPTVSARNLFRASFLPDGWTQTDGDPSIS